MSDTTTNSKPGQVLADLRNELAGRREKETDRLKQIQREIEPWYAGDHAGEEDAAESLSRTEALCTALAPDATPNDLISALTGHRMTPETSTGPNDWSDRASVYKAIMLTGNPENIEAAEQSFEVNGHRIDKNRRAQAVEWATERDPTLDLTKLKPIGRWTDIEPLEPIDELRERAREDAELHREQIAAIGPGKSREAEPANGTRRKRAEERLAVSEAFGKILSTRTGPEAVAAEIENNHLHPGVKTAHRDEEAERWVESPGLYEALILEGSASKVEAAEKAFERQGVQISDARREEAVAWAKAQDPSLDLSTLKAVARSDEKLRTEATPAKPKRRLRDGIKWLVRSERPQEPASGDNGTLIAEEAAAMAGGQARAKRGDVATAMQREHGQRPVPKIREDRTPSRGAGIGA